MSEEPTIITCIPMHGEHASELVSLRNEIARLKQALKVKEDIIKLLYEQLEAK